MSDGIVRWAPRDGAGGAPQEQMIRRGIQLLEDQSSRPVGSRVSSEAHSMFQFADGES